MKKFNIIIIVLFIVQIFFHSTIMILNKDTKLISETEKRELTAFPKLSVESYLSGEFIKQFESYMNDHFAFRDNYMNLSGKISSLYYVDTKMLVDKILPDKEKTELVDKQDNNKDNEKEIDVEIKQEEKKIEIEPIFVGKGVNILNNDRLAEKYMFSKETVDLYISAVNKIYEECGKPTTYMILPYSAEHFYIPDKFKTEKNSQESALEYLKQNIKGPIFIDVNKNLNKSDDEKIFFTLDHHWTNRGALYAYNAFLEFLGINEITDYHHGKYEGFKGSLFNSTMYNTEVIKNFKDTYDYVEYFKPQIESKVYVYQDSSLNNPKEVELIDLEYSSDNEFYNIFIAGDNPITYIESEIDNEKSILVLKDSYANSFVPFLTQNYKYIYVVDPRYFNKENRDDLIISDFFAEHQIKELMFLNYSIFVSGEYWMNFGEQYEKLTLGNH